MLPEDYCRRVLLLRSCVLVAMARRDDVHCRCRLAPGDKLEVLVSGHPLAERDEDLGRIDDDAALLLVVELARAGAVDGRGRLGAEADQRDGERVGEVRLARVAEEEEIGGDEEETEEIDDDVEVGELSAGQMDLEGRNSELYKEKALETEKEKKREKREESQMHLGNR